MNDWIDDNIVWLLGILALAVLSGSMYTCYRWGKWQERKEYTAAFIKATEDTYAEAFADGEKLGMDTGMKIGEKTGYMRCMNED